MLLHGAAQSQVMLDSRLAADRVAAGLGDSAGTLTTAVVFIDDETVLAANRGDGTIRRLDLVAGSVVGPGAVVLDLDVIVSGGDNQSEYGVQALVLHPAFAVNGWVCVRYDRSPTAGQDTSQDDVVLGPNFSASLPTDNVIERYAWDPGANGGVGGLVFDMLLRSVVVDTRYHHGGPIVFGTGNMLYTVYGDLRRTGDGGWLAQTGGALLSVNVAGGVVDDHATVVRCNDDGTVPPDNPFDPDTAGVPAGASSWHAYGIRNSFGLAVDPVTGDVWDTENGAGEFDEVNRVEAASNSGWKQVMGPLNHPAQIGSLDDIVELPGSAYSDPEFSWRDTVGVTGLHFLHGSALGPAFDDTVIAGCVNAGHLWRIELNEQRTGFVFETPALQDLTDDRVNALEDPVGADGQEIVLGLGFGGAGSGILAIERSPDGFPYLLTADGNLYRLRRSADLDADGTVGVVDFFGLLAEWGPCLDPCPPACPGDLNGDCTVDTQDFFLLLTRWG
jgi:hypothetical protein